ncbi:hypothetical protein ACO2RV_12855 [Ancylobacter sp. VNQ12]|uniref:hypothetical protein n=1 Tax=Ancylobacter sp. VNQ12 TaxID=3400920 RepID=UPI003C0797D6
MAWYVVSYDLRREVTSADYERMFSALKGATDWCRALFSFWIIETPRTPTEVIHILRTVGALDENDGVVVLEITGKGDFRRVLDQDVANWLTQRITRA